MANPLKPRLGLQAHKMLPQAIILGCKPTSRSLAACSRPASVEGISFKMPEKSSGVCRAEGVARVIEPASQASAGEDLNPVRRGVSSIKAPSASWGTVTRRTGWFQPGSGGVKRSGGRGGVHSRSPRARALGLLWGRGRGCPWYRAGLASERRQDAVVQLAWSERRQDAVANVRRDGTGSPDPQKSLNQ